MWLKMLGVRGEFPYHFSITSLIEIAKIAIKKPRIRKDSGLCLYIRSIDLCSVGNTYSTSPNRFQTLDYFDKKDKKYINIRSVFY